MDIRAGVGVRLPLPHASAGGFQIHIQIDHQIRLRQAHLSKFKIHKPVEEGRQLLIRELASLMDGIRGGIAVRENEPAVFINPAPIVPIGGKAIHREKSRSRVSVHIPWLFPEGAAEVETDQRAALLLIARKYDVIIRNFVSFHSLAQEAVLRGLAAAVNALQNDQLSLAHIPQAFSFQYQICEKTSPILPWMVRSASAGVLLRVISTSLFPR